jgi:antitoxin CptB
MLENDLLLTRFLDAEGEQLSEADAVLLTRLLETPDNELWDMLSGRSEPDDASLRPLVQRLRSC